MDELSVWFGKSRDTAFEEVVKAEVRGIDLILHSKEDDTVLILDTREVMRVVLGDPD
jgi:hypothetical protein